MAPERTTIGETARRARRLPWGCSWPLKSQTPPSCRARARRGNLSQRGGEGAAPGMANGAPVGAGPRACPSRSTPYRSILRRRVRAPLRRDTGAVLEVAAAPDPAAVDAGALGAEALAGDRAAAARRRGGAGVEEQEDRGGGGGDRRFQARRRRIGGRQARQGRGDSG